MSSPKEQEEDHPELVPVFCTVNIPLEILDNFIESSLPGGDGFFAPIILATTDIKTITQSSRTPMKPFEYPYLGWTPSEIYEFYCAIVRPLGGEISGDWTSHTFIILDERSISDKTCWLCCDAPDFLEEDRVVLKKVRSDFFMVLEETMCYETFTRCPSKSRDGRLLKTGEVLSEEAKRRGEREGHMGICMMPPAMSSEQRRAAISYGIKIEGEDGRD